MYSNKSEIELLAMAAEALRRARQLPIGEKRNEQRQIAICFKYLAKRREVEAKKPFAPNASTPYFGVFR